MKELLLRLGPLGDPIADGPSNGNPLFKLHLLISAASPISKNGKIWTNIPPLSSISFNRNKLYKYNIQTFFSNDSIIHLDIYKPGSFYYYISYSPPNSSEIKTTRKFYIFAQPTLSINNKFLPLNSISIQSLVSKWLGPKKNWNSIFNHISNDKKYNMIHFTPLQSRGESNSPYSIYDQLKFDPNLFDSTDDVKSLVSSLQKNHNLLSMTDIVWNHTANNSQWIRDHPEVGYNAKTAPHLTAAIELDSALLEFSDQMKSLGYPTIINSVDDLLKIMDGIKIHVLGSLKLWQFYIIDVQSSISNVLDFYKSNKSDLFSIDLPKDFKNSLPNLAKFTLNYSKKNPFALKTRYYNQLDTQKFTSVLVSILNSLSIDDPTLDQIKDQARKILDEINLPFYKIYDNDVSEILEQLYNRIKFLRLDSHGPKLGEITSFSALTETYFTRFKDPKTGEQHALANNGWIWNGDSLVDFASDKTKAYLRREVIIWGDCVKLRYGSKPEDSPYLWKRMIQYTELCASIFHGFRIDNCHSTPLHVGEKLLDVARNVNPNLYVVAELFTGSEEMDRIFVERLGICSLIREAMQAWSVGELSRLVHRHGGRPIGSLTWLPLDELPYPCDKEPSQYPQHSDFVSEIQIPLTVTRQEPHALFMDCTHDNETPNQKRTVEDTLPNAALVSLCSCAVGSVFGYDECYPELLDVVNEKRTYTFSNTGISLVKKKIYEIRDEISNESTLIDDHQMHVHHEGQFITLHRVNSKTGNGWFLIARTKFSNDTDQYLAPIYLSGTRAKSVFAYALKKTGEYKYSDTEITSIPTTLEKLDDPQFQYDPVKNETKIIMPNCFPQGSIALLSTKIIDADESLDQYIRTGAIAASKNLTLYDLNALLFRCESEERDSSGGNESVYNIPDYGDLVYAGLQGWVSVLKDVIRKNDLAHPICSHLRSGKWALDYIVNRLNKYNKTDGFEEFKLWLSSRLNAIKKVPFFLIPHYFALVVGIAYEACRFRVLKIMSSHISHGTLFVQNLAMCSVQMVGYMNSTSIKPFEQVPCMAAGLPHFSTNYMRCWGRDIFISLRGLLLATGRFADAKQHIVCAGSTLKHGLIPNLLDAGRNPRYNARDAVWFWLQSVQDYIDLSPNGEDILDIKVKRRFPLDDRFIDYNSDEAFSYSSSIKEIIFEILSRHAKGIKYREANAGPNLDSQMKDEGFNVEVHVDWSTGLVHGGSQLNCGTWMDKMGESERAHNKGIPGTPRDGAPVEINGLLKSALRFVVDLNKKGLFPYSKVTTQDDKEITFSEWNDLVQSNFEKCFYIPLESKDDVDYEIKPNIVNRRGIYKDLFKSGKPYEDYQLRPNFPIAMVVAPELFTPSFALKALKIADDVIAGPVGMRTLDPSDLNYRPYYVNWLDNEDFATSKGRNYHQGPEWVWVFGYFLRAYAHFYAVDIKAKGGTIPSEDLQQFLSSKLKGHKKWLRESSWAGLTELTNKDGNLCDDSSPTQAWSASCLVDLYYDIWRLENKK
ncbi:bifunctional 4-alpha-glucanotransferase/amylo-alpha-1,6-glucosidase [Ascoidea rubescens DSM 1968]|uniref:Glycogen debranching enzyme n=1 Tax=Ascoidea rubescens DSM 1968 TaxID=1344418 RepID=A0A1D2VJH8_9ASCO|nr:glycoside hydrolase family 13 protein [Ascoidea rubescens DSM 1968]ODV61769.1 glycoside hydrolase family 13 protein [Ascoidea rubescens DSM 1968]